MKQAPTTHDRIYAVVRRIPRGKVATYGQIAALAGMPRQARLVGYALHNLKPSDDVPWHRVINSAGRISMRSGEGGCDNLQRAMLEAEGVKFSASGKIDLEVYRWEAKPQRDAAHTPLSGGGFHTD